MIDVNKIVTLETNEKFLIISDIKVNNEKYFFGVKIDGEKYENDFRVFTLNVKNSEKYFEQIMDPKLTRLIVEAYVINHMKDA